MKTLSTCVLAIALCSVAAVGQITMFPQSPPGSPPPAAFVSPTVMDFDAGAPPAGLVGNQEPYFLAFGLCSVEIVNAPGLHTPLGDLLSSGYFGNCLASVNNQLSIVAPNGAMDNHTAGAGWRFVLAPGTFATQFGGLVTDQVNHPMAVETWFGGALVNTFSFTMSGTGSFPNPHIYFEDLAGFDEVRFMNVSAAGGWGIDDFTLANVVGTPVPCGPTPAAPWQVNSAISSLDLDGVSGSSFQGAVTTVCVGGATTLNSVSTPGTPTDIAVVFAATGPTMALSSPNNVVNIDVLHPTMFSFNGGVPNFAGLLNLVPHPGAFSFPVPTGGPFVGSAQQLAIDPSNADGYALSQASQLDVTVGGPGVAGPTADDTPIQISLTGTGFCSGAGSIAFYGTTYTQMWISPNGRVAFSASPGIDYTPTLAEALSQTEIVGYWTDLSPNAGGNVTVTNTATSGYRIDWSGVPYFATPAPLNSFAIEFDPSGVVTLDGLTGIGPQPGVAIGGDDAFLGMSPGGPGGATDDGPTTFGAGLAGGPVNAASMLYDFYSASTGAGLSGSLLPGTLNRIDFVPSGLNNYLWIGL